MYPNYPYFAVAITRTCGSGGGSYIGKSWRRILILICMTANCCAWQPRTAASMKKSLPLPMKTPKKRCYTVFRGISTTAASSRRRAAISSVTRTFSTIRPRSCGSC